MVKTCAEAFIVDFLLSRVVLVPRSNLSKIYGQKFEEIIDNGKNTISGGIFFAVQSASIQQYQTKK